MPERPFFRRREKAAVAKYFCLDRRVWSWMATCARHIGAENDSYVGRLRVGFRLGAGRGDRVRRRGRGREGSPGRNGAAATPGKRGRGRAQRGLGAGRAENSGAERSPGAGRVPCCIISLEYPVLVWAKRDGYHSIPAYTVGMVNTWYIPVFAEYAVPSALAGAAARVTWTDLLASAPGREDPRVSGL